MFLAIIGFNGDLTTTTTVLSQVKRSLNCPIAAHPFDFLEFFFSDFFDKSTMNNNIISILDSQINRYFATHQPRNACEWALAVTEVSSVFNDLVRVGYSAEEIQSFVDRALSTARLFGMPKSKLVKLEQALVVPEEEEEGDEGEEEDDDLLEDEEIESTVTPVVSSASPQLSAKSTSTSSLPIVGGHRWRRV